MLMLLNKTLFAPSHAYYHLQYTCVLEAKDYKITGMIGDIVLKRELDP